jgi:hypothetical protein
VSVVKVFALGLAMFAVLASAAAGAERDSTTLYGLLPPNGGGDLVRVDPNMLRPVGRHLAVGEFGTTWAFSPDRSRLALGWSYTPTLGRVGAIRIVDLRHWRSERVITLDGELGSLQAASWVGNRLLALVSRPGGYQALALDTRTGRVFRRLTEEGLVLHAVPSTRGLTLLVAPQTGIGAARVVQIDRALDPRSITLDRIVAGTGITENDNGQLVAGRSQFPGFALRSGAVRPTAYVLGPGAPPAVIDLASLTSRYAPTRALAARTKTIEGSWRIARWAGGTNLAYGGIDHALDGTATRAGVALIDTATWERRTLDPRATTAVAGGGLILAWDSWPAADRSLGVRAFGLDAALRFAALPGAAVDDVQLAGRRALVQLSGSRPVAAVLDLRTGATVTSIRGNVPRLLVGRAAAW